MMHRILLTLSLFIGAEAYPYQRVQTDNDPLGLPLGNFSLQDRTGKTIARDDLRGKVWIAHFFFTTCSGDCTKTAPTMIQLQKDFAGKPDLALVSISLNNDSPETLDEYARDMGAEPGQWYFLTGPKKEVHDLVQQSFFQSAQESGNPQPGLEVNHTPNLLVIDREGRIHGYMDGRDPWAARVLKTEASNLAASRYKMARWNALLNGTCGILLVLGYLVIRRPRFNKVSRFGARIILDAGYHLLRPRLESLHKFFMLSALAVSMVFLACYLYYHFAILQGQPTRFQGQGAVRWLYFGILLSHTILAAAVAPLALMVTWHGLQDRRARHVRLARWTLPIWIYVSVTGVVVYWMLYHLYPPF